MHTIDMNMYVRAPTQYSNVEFNSYANFNGIKISASDAGLFEMCCGDTDNGDNIDSSFSPITTDFGIKQPKRLRYVYVGFESDDDLTLEVSVDDGSVRSYTIPANKINQQRVRVTINRNGKGRYWKFNFKNTNGCKFAIDSVDVIAYVLSEGFR